MYNINEYKEIIRERLSDYRYYHSLCVAQKAKELALKYNQDDEKAYIAGILHDVMKESTKEEQLEIIDKADIELTELELASKKFLHQYSGFAFAKLKLGIEDEDILNSIKYHTTGKADMTMMEQIIYLADFISDDRDYKDVDIIREEAKKGIGEGMLYGTKYTIQSVVKKGNPLHPLTVDAYNWILKTYFKEN